MKKQLTLLITLLLIASLLFGCGAKSEGAMDMGNAGNSYEGEKAPELSGSAESTAILDTSGQKLVRKLRLNAETEDLEALLTAIDEKITALSGYIEAREIYNGSQYSSYRYRNASMTVRIPVENMESFVSHVRENTNITNSNETVDNITLSYVATQSRITALETEQTRLLELLAQAESMEDLLKIESRLTQVRTELEEVTSQLRLYDNMVDYATITLEINEVTEYSPVEEAPDTVWQRISKGFVKSLKGMGSFFVELFVFLIVSSPYLLFIGLIAFGIILLCKWKKKNKKQ